jgi:hypothetical protein
MRDNIDLANLRFLLHASEDVLKEWYETTSHDDRVYAKELLQAYSTELTIKAVLLGDPDVADLTLATDSLKKYSIKS